MEFNYFNKNLKPIRLRCSNLITRFFLYFRDPFIIKIEDISVCSKTGRMMVSYHATGKRTGDRMSVQEFIKSPLIYHVDPKIVFLIGEQAGAYNERLFEETKLQNGDLKHTCLGLIKRIFIDPSRD